MRIRIYNKLESMELNQQNLNNTTFKSHFFHVLEVQPLHDQTHQQPHWYYSILAPFCVHKYQVFPIWHNRILEKIPKITEKTFSSFKQIKPSSVLSQDNYTEFKPTPWSHLWTGQVAGFI